MLNFLPYLILLGIIQNAICDKLFDTKYFVVQHENSIDAEEANIYQHSSNYTEYRIMLDESIYQCYIPVIESSETAMNSLNNDPNTLKEEKELAIDAIRNFHRMQRNTSVSTNSGYWKYMLRFDHDILQLHSETSAEGAIFINHFKLASWSDNSDPFSLETIPYYMDKGASDPYEFESDFELINSEDGTKYVTQRLGNGEICDLTGSFRTTVINYRCNEKASVPVLKNIHEWRTCDYVMDLEANYFCQFPMWSSSRSTLKTDIDCFPDNGNLSLSYHEKLRLQGSELEPLKNGIFFVKNRMNPHKFEILLTKKYDEKLDQLLYDIIEGIQNKINFKSFVLWEDSLPIYVASINTPFTIGYAIYDVDLSYLGTVQIDSNINGKWEGKFVGLELPNTTNCLDCKH